INTVWEGSGNVVALDILRAMAKSPESVDAFFAECEPARGSDPRLDAHLDRCRAALDMTDPEFQARALVEDLALALQGSLMVRHSTPEAAGAFCASRLGDRPHKSFGTLPAGTDAAAIADRALTV
ncbi:MAG: alkylation response protein, partial [Solirubrobacteraceae bacterium]|nr:alkylation response protein [Solirubrobacteraceae bacterium]